jgi:hypothetical protein
MGNSWGGAAGGNVVGAYILLELRVNATNYDGVQVQMRQALSEALGPTPKGELQDQLDFESRWPTGDRMAYPDHDPVPKGPNNVACAECGKPLWKTVTNGRTRYQHATLGHATGRPSFDPSASTLIDKGHNPTEDGPG